MATHHLNRVNWEKSLSLDRQQSTLHLLPLIKKRTISPPITTTITTTKNSSFLHSQKLKQELIESRKAFLNLTCSNEDEPEAQEEKTVSETIQKEVTQKVTTTPTTTTTITTTTTTTPVKKISFKIKKSGSIYRRNNISNTSNNSGNNAKMTTIGGNNNNNNKVAELTMKFNNIIENSTQINRKPSGKNHVQRKPSVKTKPNFNLSDKKVIIIKRKPIIVRKVSNVKRNDHCTKSPPVPPPKPTSPPPGGGGTVRETIAIFERNHVPTTLKVPEELKPIINDDNNKEKTDIDEEVQIISMPPMLPQRRCDSMYETSNLKRIQPVVAPSVATLKSSKIEEIITKNPDNNRTIIKPNTSFLWSLNQDKSPQNQNDSVWENLYDFVDPKPILPPKPANFPTLPKKINKPKMPLPPPIEKIYEELNGNDKNDDDISHNYEYCENDDDDKYEIVGNNNNNNNDDDDGGKTDDGYEYCKSPNNENIYETLPAVPPPPPPPLLPKRQQQEPLPPRPPSRNSYCTIQNSEETVSNCYESIYNPETNSQISKNSDSNKCGNNNKNNSNSGDIESSNYESIYGCHLGNIRSNRDSLISSDQQSNSLYGRTSFVGCWADDDNIDNNSNTYKATSDLSASDKSDEWIDMTDNEDNGDDNSTGFIIIRERHKPKKTSGWSQQFREQWLKSTQNLPKDLGADSDTDHHYETLGSNNTKEDINEDDYDSFDSETESETSLQKTHMNDSGVDIGNHQLPDPPNNNQTYVLTRLAATAGKHMRKLRRNWSLTKNDITKSLSRMRKRKSRTDLETLGINTTTMVVTTTNTTKIEDQEQPKSYQNIEINQQQSEQIEDKTKTLTRKGFLNKFRRSMSLSAESATELTTNLDNNKPKSTFYLTQDIDIDNNEESETSRDSGASLSPVTRNNKTPIVRPQSPPPPVPNNNNKKRSTSWYAEVGLFKNTTNENSLPKRPNTCWYAEVGLYQTSRSTPSTSSAENSGTNISLTTKTTDLIINEDNDEYYNIKNDENYDNNNSLSSTETKKDDQSLTSLTPDIQLRLQDEPLYQFYDAAVLESVCKDGTSDFDSDGYEEVGDRNTESRLSLRPSAMELVSPRNSLAFNRTLWCEIPEVIQSTVLSTLNSHQKKLQEAKFEMITSEASYLNSLQVLTNHFIHNLENSNILNVEELEILFSKVDAVKNCSEKLLLDLEKCWQDNILLHGVIDIIQKHAEENFDIYVTYCANQILIDDTLKRIKEKPGFVDLLRQLETSSACQSLTLYSFLMLPMQRITRWPLLVDAVLKRLAPQDDEYLTCQYALATLNKIVNQCNEAAKRKERELEMKKIVNQLEFAKGVRPIDILIDGRFLIRSGSVTHMQQRNDEIKLTFGRRFIKITLHIFLFNDLILMTKPKNDNLYTIIHYCPRNLVELNSQDMLNSLTIKDAQVRHLLFLTLLENQNEKTVEFLLSCSSETDKERWIEALTPPKSDNPDETLYECWDCPQVTAVHNYTANQPDELALSRGDIINVLRKMADGWYHGERIRDGQTGWFPANYTTEIANPHVRSRNLKQRYRLLAFSENYLRTK